MIEKLATSSVLEAKPCETLQELKIKEGEELSPIKNNMELIDNTSIESLRALNAIESQIIDSELVQPPEAGESETNQTETSETRGLTEAEREQIRQEMGWSDEIIDAITSMEEYAIYKNADLLELEINGKKCLVRNDIDLDQTDFMGRTNKERMEAGLAPIGKNGETIELHHIGQKKDGPLAELTPDEHRGKENYSVLHDTKKESEIDRIAFNSERSDHWKTRTNTGA